MYSFDPIYLTKTVAAAAFELAFELALVHWYFKYRKSLPEAEFLEEIQTKFLRIFSLLFTVTCTALS